MMGGLVKGGRVLGKHPDNYDKDDITDLYITGRGCWIPTTPWEAMWVSTMQSFSFLGGCKPQN